MLDRLKTLFLGGDDAPKDGGGKRSTDELHVAAAALMAEAASLDGDFDERERTVIAAVLENRFDLDAAEAAELLDAGHEAAAGSNQLFAFTRTIKDRLSEEERIMVIEMLWEVAYADGHLHDFESNLVRRVAGLIYVPDRESGAARKRVLERLAQSDMPRA
jgi:uncharacterized tellurite resistance protein B-like protein